MYRVGGDLAVIEVEHLRQRLEGEAGRQTGHAFVHARVVAVFLVALGLGVGVLEVLAVVDPHLGEDAGVLGLFQPRQHRELRQHFQCVGRARRFGQRAMNKQLLVDADLVRHPQAVGHLDRVDAIQEGLVVLVVLERDPLGLVRVCHHDAIERNRPEALGTLVVTLLSGGQQRMQDLDRCLEHLDELKQTAVCQAQTAGVAVGVGIVLRILLKLADVDLADQRGNILVVLVAWLGLGDGNLTQHRRRQLDYAEPGDVAVEFMKALYGPGRHDGAEVTAGNAVVVFKDMTVLKGVEQPQRRLVDRRTLDGIEGHALNQGFQLFGERRLAAADGAEEVEDLFLFLQSLCRMSEVRHDVLDDFFHAVEVTEGRVELQNLVGKDP
ncbi:hypothetical protein SDC9_120490 [bioreactor metagenome]|uniref:Uncharacterized protein n=1 Tax=bioreactor metagenome TaxID=1076179 RepID=A0A645C6Z1_9ZZZZ